MPNKRLSLHRSAFFSRLFALIVLAAGLSLSACETGEEVTIRTFEPLGEVTTTTNFTLSFSKDLVPDSLLNQPLETAPITFSPEIPGQFQWINPHQLRFYPEEALAPSTEYSATVKSSVVGGAPYHLSGDRMFTFFTPLFRVQSASLTYQFTPVQGEVVLVGSVQFNYPISADDVGDRLHLEYADGSNIPFKILPQTSATKTVISIEAEGVRRETDGGKVQLIVPKGTVALGSNRGLEADYTHPLTLPGQVDLRVERLAPVRQGPNSGYFELRFNLPVNVEAAKDFIQVEPAVDFTLEGRHHSLVLTGPFKIGENYQVTAQQGLTAIDGTPLEREFSSAAMLMQEDIQPQIEFVGEGFYLARSGPMNLGLSTINMGQVDVEVQKVFVNNLVHLLNATRLDNPYDDYYYWGSYNINALGQRLAQPQTLTVQNQLNQEVVTPVSVQDYVPDEGLGLYQFIARDHEERWRSTTKWVLATNMGLVAKKANKDLWVWVNDLASLQPKVNAILTLYSQNNQELMQATTNADGLAVFTNFTEQDFPPYVVTATSGDDFSFLELTNRLIPTTDFDVGGAAYLENGYEGFVYSERGVYRPGEVAKLAVIVRGENVRVPASFPTKLRITGPDNKILTEQRSPLNTQGAAEFQITLPDYIRTGRYNAQLLIGDNEELGRTRFSVEEFVPDRMKVTVNTDKAAYAADETVQTEVEGLMLFGPPAADRVVQANMVINSARFAPQAWRSYTFTDPKKTFEQYERDLGDQTLDAQGRYTYAIDLPNVNPPESLTGTVYATVLEPGGRGVTNFRSFRIHPYEAYVGLRKVEAGYAEPGQDTAFEFVTLNTEGETTPGRALEVKFYRIYWHTIWKNVRGRYRYVSERVEEEVDRFNVTSAAGPGTFQVRPNTYGSYRVEIRDRQSGHSAAIRFYASGWGYSPWAMDNPDRIELDLDKESYQPGETARVQVRAPFGGKLLLTVEREQVFTAQVIDMPENTGVIEVPINANYKPNVYISAHLIRSTDGLERDASVRAFGVVPLHVNADENRLDITLNAPDELRPNQKITVDFAIDGFTGAAPYVTIAAVDEGICQLTGFETPDPHAYFFGKKRLSIESYDLYGIVLPEIQSSLISTGGDDEALRQRQLAPVDVKRTKPVAFWSGLVQADNQGRGQVSFDIPAFNGSIRLMAVAFAGNTFGQERHDMIVRDPIVLSPTFPRFISSTDELKVPVAVFNGTGADREISVTLDALGPVDITNDARQRIRIPHEREAVVYFDLKAQESTGKIAFTVTASGGGQTSEAKEEVPLLPPVPFITLAGNGSAQGNQTSTFTFPDNWTPGTTDFSVTISAFPTIQFGGSLQYLLRYPHGCLEQTTSRAFPLLAFNDLARVVEPNLFNRNSADYFIDQAIAKLANMQQPSGAFVYWPSGTYSNNWSSIYASHFLIEARRAGYTVPDRVYDRFLQALRVQSRTYEVTNRYSLQPSVYALYVLALAGEAERSTMLFIKNNAMDRLSDYSRFQLAGAFALAGDVTMATSILPQTAQPPQTTNQAETGGNFNSSTRAKAIILDILAEIDPEHPLVPTLVQDLTQTASQNRRWGNTQENAYAFLALGKILQQQGDGTFTGQISIEGTAFSESFDHQQSQTFNATDWAGKTVTLNIQGEGPAYYYWRADGIPGGLHVNEYDNDLVVRRRFLNEQGQAIRYNEFRQGEMVVAEITVRAPNETLENVAIVDMLPAGLEIENPRLESRRGIPWVQSQYQPAYMDIRNDRMIFYGTFRNNQSYKFHYSLRAVTEGTFMLPPIRGEAMYAPQKASVANSGRITVRGLQATAEETESTSDAPDGN